MRLQRDVPTQARLCAALWREIKRSLFGEECIWAIDEQTAEFKMVLPNRDSHMLDLGRQKVYWPGLNIRRTITVRAVARA